MGWGSVVWTVRGNWPCNKRVCSADAAPRPSSHVALTHLPFFTVSCGSAQAECRCVVGGTCDRVMGRNRALTSTRVAHAECRAGGYGRGARLLR